MNKSEECGLNVLADNNINLSDAQKELLRWHFKLGHFNLNWIQRLTRIREGEENAVLPTHLKSATSCPIPLCAACQLAKAHRRPEQAVEHQKVRSKDGNLKDGHLVPGMVVSTDQFVSKVHGRLPHTMGKEKEQDMYCGGTIYVDHSSGYMLYRIKFHLERKKHFVESIISNEKRAVMVFGFNRTERIKECSRRKNSSRTSAFGDNILISLELVHTIRMELPKERFEPLARAQEQ